MGFSALSIKSKIVLIVLIGVSLSMLIALISFISYDRRAIHQYLTEELNVLAAITAQRSGAALAFNDERAARSNLESLSIRENILAGCIYRADGQLFAKFHRPPTGLGTTDTGAVNGDKTVTRKRLPRTIQCPEPWRFDDLNNSQRLREQKQFSDTIVVEKRITNNQRLLGCILVISDLSPVKKRLQSWVGLSLVMIVITALGIAVMVMRMQKAIVNPILHLTAVMSQVKANNDLSLRASALNQDEIGRLINAFNEMLSLIEGSNMDLEIVYSELISRSTEAEANAVELEVRNQEIKDFLSGAAHDLRQPLQAMSIFVEMLEMAMVKASANPQQGDLILKLKAAMDNLQSMFTEILDVSRLEYKRGEAELQEIHLSDIISKLQLEFGVLAQNEGLELRLHVGDIRLLTVPGILERLIRNLVSNAIRYTGTGGVLIAARKRKEATWIEVWDTGRGIDQQHLETIFHTFDQGDSNNTERGSYGLGLAIVKNFAHMLGYELVVRSTLGHGSLFRLVIPNRENPHDKQTFKMVGASEKSDNLSVSHDYQDVIQSMLKTQIVLVDDDASIRHALKTALECWDMEVVDFPGLTELWEYFQGGDFVDPDMIISDFQLQDGVTGDQIIEEVRSLIGIEIPALIVTGNRSYAIKHAIESKGYDYLYKPVDLKTLKKRIQQGVD